ncbi:MAG: P-type DNA transfer ATPase VirB11 [Methylotenera sp.]|nr:P-type DNA transfer ATPase VirB11 [Methylotenera sp.]
MPDDTQHTKNQQGQADLVQHGQAIGNEFQDNEIKGDETLCLLLEPITHYLNEDGVTDIFVNKPYEIIVKNDKGRKKIKAPSLSLAHLEQIAVAVGNYSNQGINKSAPIISANLPNDERIQVVLPPVVQKGLVNLSIRKPMILTKTMAEYEADELFSETVWLRPREMSFDAHDFNEHHLAQAMSKLSKADLRLIDLLENKSIGQFFIEAVNADKNISIVGETGSGKTTFSKMLCQSIPQHESIITIEDARELFLPNHEYVVHLTYSKGGQGQAKVTPSDLIHSTMRMNPDRVLLAELRGAESYDYLKLLLSGHGGSITSWHAGSPEEAIGRFIFMAKEHPESTAYQDVAIKRLLLSAVDVIAHLEARSVFNENDVQIGTEYKMTAIYFNPFKKLEVALET